MDKKNFLFGIICLFIAFSLFINQEKRLAEKSSQPQLVENTASTPISPVQKPERVSFSMPQQRLDKSHLVTLENEAIKVHFSTLGGSIHSIELKHYPAVQSDPRPFVFNEEANLPALTLLWQPQHPIISPFSITEQTENFIQFCATLEDGTQIVRGYRLAASKDRNPYVIKNEFLIQQKAHVHDHIWVSLGRLSGTVSDKYQEYLNFCSYDGKNTEFKRAADFEASNGFFGLGRKKAQTHLVGEGQYVWNALKNQFFTAILTSQSPATGYLTYPSTVRGIKHLEGLVKFDLFSGQNRITSSFYVGPKDYILLDKMGQNQDQLMQFGFFGAISKLLLLSMRAIHSIIPNWGWTIILLTIIIKLLMWPITQAQLRSSKKISNIQGPLKVIREKFKNNPQKLQTETMRLFKENRVNPAAGCLPIFIQIPIFIGLYYMLRTSSEIRFQSFLWVKDLSISDTVATIGQFPINILPILMGITMFLQMKMTPTPTMDGMQQKIIMWMPFIFLIFCYTFPAALVLYWTVQNLFTIFQQWLTRRYSKEEQPVTFKH